MSDSWRHNQHSRRLYGKIPKADRSSCDTNQGPLVPTSAPLSSTIGLFGLKEYSAESLSFLFHSDDLKGAMNHNSDNRREDNKVQGYS